MMSGARIMVVEDSWNFSAFMRDLLTLSGYPVLPVISSGEDAVRTAESSRPDIVLIDAEGNDRLDCIESGEHISEYLSIPVIFITGYADDDTPNRVNTRRLSSYLVKPFDRTELKAAIEIALYKYRAQAGAGNGAEIPGHNGYEKNPASGIRDPWKEIKEYRAEICRLNMEIAEFKEIIESLNISLNQMQEHEDTLLLTEEESAPPEKKFASMIEFESE